MIFVHFLINFLIKILAFFIAILYNDYSNKKTTNTEKEKGEIKNEKI